MLTRKTAFLAAAFIGSGCLVERRNRLVVRADGRRSQTDPSNNVENNRSSFFDLRLALSNNRSNLFENRFKYLNDRFVVRADERRSQVDQSTNVDNNLFNDVDRNRKKKRRSCVIVMGTTGNIRS